MFKINDRVNFSAEFCRQTNQMEGDIPFLRGVVQAVEKIDELVSCLVLWEGYETPTLVAAEVLSPDISFPPIY